MEIEELQSLQALAKEAVSNFKIQRFLYPYLLEKDTKVFTGIIGPRGVGKTVLLRQLSIDLADSFYISLDTLEQDTDLFDLAKTLNKSFGVKTLLLDEVHFRRGINADLKKIYDYLDLRVVFTSSVSLLMSESAYDLSRRVILKSLPPLSFREYLAFSNVETPPPITLKDIVSGQLSSEYLSFEHRFESYLKGGNFAFSEETDEILLSLKNVIQKTINSDIANTKNLSPVELDSVTKTLSFIGKSAIDGINPNSISNNLKITKYKAEQYISILEDAYLLCVVSPRGTNVRKEPKITMLPPYRLLYQNYEEALGGLREDFAVNMLKMSGYELSYLKSKRGEKCPDYMVQIDGEKLVLEIGGSSKGSRQFKGVSYDKKLIFQHSGGNYKELRSLSLLGFLY